MSRVQMKGLPCVLCLAVALWGSSTWAATQTPRIPPPVVVMPRVDLPQPDQDRLRWPERRRPENTAPAVRGEVGGLPEGALGSWIRIAADNSGTSWRVTVPGTYAAEVCRLTVASPDAVALAVAPGCTDLVTPSGTVIPTWYAFGDSIAEANASGWIPAGRFGGMTFLTLLGRPGEAGRTITIWSKIDTTMAPAEPNYRASFELSVYVVE